VIGWDIWYHLVASFSPGYVVRDILLVVGGTVGGSWLSIAITDALEPQGISWPWRRALKGPVRWLLTRHPFLAVELAKVARHPGWLFAALVTGGVAVIASLLAPSLIPQVVVLLSLVPTWWAVSEARSAPCLPDTVTLPSGARRWMWARVAVTGSVSLIPGAVVLAETAYAGVLSSEVVKLVALWLTSGLLGMVGGTLTGVFTWRRTRTPFDPFTVGITGTVVWVAATLIPALYTLPSNTNPAAGIVGLVLTSTFAWVAVSRTAVMLERRDFGAVSDDA